MVFDAHYRVPNIDLETKRLELEMEASNKMLESMQLYAKITFSSLVMVNGGAILALLTFLGNAKYMHKFSELWSWAISSFCLGLISVLISMFYAFWAQKLFREGLDKDIKQNIETDTHQKDKFGLQKRNLCIFFAIASIGCFVCGSLCAILALQSSV